MPPPAVTRYSELQIVTLGVRDLARARAFYAGVGATRLFMADGPDGERLEFLQYATLQ